MDFVSTQDFGSEAERLLWESIKSAFATTEPGYCWHRYPITSRSGPRLEPDLLILHPQWGLNVIEVKGCSINHIEAIEGHIWYMTGWTSSEIEPYDQAQKHMWAILDRLKGYKYGLLRDETSGNCRIAGRAFVGLPFITEQEWRKRFGEHLSAPKWELVFSTDLELDALRHTFANAPIKQKPLSEEEWEAVVAIIKGSEALQRKPRRPAKRENSRAAWLRQVEQQMAAFDLEQHRVAVQVPPGPQRIRGLAGTGKTVVLAQKAAHMHVVHPDWDIVFTFYSRPLHEQIRNYITRFVQEFSQGEISEPDWNKVRIWYGWGAFNQPGLYRHLCTVTKSRFRGFTDAQNHFSTISGRVALDKCCEELLGGDTPVPELFDAILVDEAQDFAENYFRLCFQTLRQPRRLVWGYDEVQSLEELIIPTAETLFGYDADGKPLVDLSGTYPGEIQQDEILYRCYRNPRPVLIAAHAFGLGLLRKGGTVQFIDSVAGWQDIGYEVREGATDGKMISGSQVTICRPQENSPHLLEKLAGYHNLIQNRLFESREKELEWIVEDVARNIQEEELKPEEIAIVALESRQKIVTSEFAILRAGLTAKGIASMQVGLDSKDIFRAEGAVTITSVFRAKGSEASLVYVYGFEDVSGNADVVRKRNRAFTAMTRTRGWLVLTGIARANELFQEIEAILEKIGCVSFIVPDMTTIQRNLETYENQRKRERARKAEKSLSQLIKDLADVNPDDLSAEQRQQLYRLLFSKNDKQE
ncbi:MAG: NERD domain-containing protein [Chloroflexota bacterium]